MEKLSEKPKCVFFPTKNCVILRTMLKKTIVDKLEKNEDESFLSGLGGIMKDSFPIYSYLQAYCLQCPHKEVWTIQYDVNPENEKWGLDT